MINPSKKIMKITYGLAGLFTLIFILTITLFSPSSNANKKRHTIQLQFIHEADISNIDIITIQHGDSAIILSRSDNMWLLANQNDVNEKIPADVQKLKSFFILLASKHTMAKAGNTADKDNSYGLDTEEGTTITLYKNGLAYQSLNFGALNFSQTQRYFTSAELKSVFLAGQEFDAFLTTSVTAWADPYIISTQLLNDVFSMGLAQTADFYDYQKNQHTTLTSFDTEENKSIQKLFDLRHGGFALDLQNQSANDQQNKVLAVKIQMGDKSQINLDIFKHPAIENEYIVFTTFNSQRLEKSFSYKTQISAWTYSKISEMMLNTK